MALTSLATFAPGDTIPSAWANLIRDNFLAIDARTGGDPATADKWLVSSGATAAAWVARATAVLAAIGYTPVNKAGDTMSGNLTISVTGAPTQGFVLYGNSGTRFIGFDGTQFLVVGGGLNLAGLLTAVAGLTAQSNITVQASGVPTQGYTFYGNSGTIFIGGDGGTIVTNTGKVWTEGNDGPASGLAAQTAASASDSAALGGLTSAQHLARANHTGTQIASTISDLATAVSGMAAASAGTAANATQLGGVAASGYPRRASGSYSGNGAASQNIPLGISALVVLVTEITNSSNGCSAIVMTGKTVTSQQVASVFSMLTDNTVGISGTTLVAGSGAGINTSGKTYTWVAFA